MGSTYRTRAAAYKVETPLEIADGVPNVFSLSVSTKIKI